MYLTNYITDIKPSGTIHQSQRDEYYLLITVRLSYFERSLPITSVFLFLLLPSLPSRRSTLFSVNSFLYFYCFLLCILQFNHLDFFIIIISFFCTLLLFYHFDFLIFIISFFAFFNLITSIFSFFVISFYSLFYSIKSKSLFLLLPSMPTRCSTLLFLRPLFHILSIFPLP